MHDDHTDIHFWRLMVTEIFLEQNCLLCYFCVVFCLFTLCTDLLHVKMTKTVTLKIPLFLLSFLFFLSLILSVSLAETFLVKRALRTICYSVEREKCPEPFQC